MTSIAEGLSARINSLVGDANALSDEGDATASESESESTSGAPPSGSASGADSAAAASEGTHAPSGATAAEATAAGAATEDRTTQHALLQEKLAQARERRQAQRIAERAKAERSQAEADRKAAAEERSKWESLSKGTFKEGLLAMGRDPREVFNEMVKEAEEAGTPEAQIASLRVMFEKQMVEKLEPLQKELEDLKKQRDEAQKQAGEARFGQDFSHVVARPEFGDLLVEYDAATLFKVVRSLRDDPARMHENARRLQVNLTGQGGGYNMLDILNVLRAQQSEHEKGKAERRARIQASNPSPAAETQAAPAKPTVNGTAEKRNAGTTLGNDLVSTTASSKGGRLATSRHDRIKKLVENG